MELSLLRDIVIIFGLAIVVLLVFHRLRLPVVVGYLLTGLVAGPHGLRLLRNVHDVELLAEVGVILLLFTIGLEFSLSTLWRIRRAVFLGGAAQVLLTIAAAAVIASWTGAATGAAIFIGFLTALSSTAIVLKLIQDRAEVNSPHGRTILGILIFQDVIVVVMMLLTPLLAGAQENLWRSVAGLAGVGVILIALTVVSARWLVPRLLLEITRTRSRELFVLSLLGLCAGIAWATSQVGLSLALGAFLAGLIISESEYSEQAIGNILPFRDVFTSFFFVSIGMLLDLSFVATQPLTILALTIGVLLLKATLAGSATLLLGQPLQTAVVVGLSLSQVGEFSFVLARVGLSLGLLPGDIYQQFLAVSILSMAATPFMVMLAPRLGRRANRPTFIPARLKQGLYHTPALTDLEWAPDNDHVIVVGFGVNGRNVARAASAAGIHYVVLEINPDTVRSEQMRGEPIYYGDAGQEAVLEHAGIHRARAVVCVISDAAATRHIVATCRRLNPAAYIIARTRLVSEVAYLYQLGASEVIPEEFETSVEIFTRLLVQYLVPRAEIERFIAQVRAEGYEMFRSPTRLSPSISDLAHHLQPFEITAVAVHEGSGLADQSLTQTALRQVYGVTLLGIRRGAEAILNPAGDTVIRSGDVLFLLGSPEQIAHCLSAMV